MKQLSEVLETEAPRSSLPPEPVLHLEAPSSSELDLPLGTQFSLEDQMPPWSQTELPSKQVFSEEETGQPSETPMASQGSDKPLRDAETPRSSGTESNRKVYGRELGSCSGIMSTDSLRGINCKPLILALCFNSLLPRF